jgi:ABC-type bacteriocin/lantibiotic exporter with double-glycine peptidase domain
LTEFRNRTMLAPRSREVHVSEARKNLVFAVGMTVADAAVVIWYGGVIWQTFCQIIWSTILILLLAALWALSFARIWARAIYSLRHVTEERSIQLPPSAAMSARQLQGGADV